MMWIDGDYFADPVVQRKIEKAIAISKSLISGCQFITKLIKDGVPFDMIEELCDMPRLQTAIIIAQPLFPPEAGGGFVIPINVSDGPVVIPILKVTGDEHITVTISDV